MERDNAVIKALFKRVYGREMTEGEIENFYTLNESFEEKIIYLAKLMKKISEDFLSNKEIDFYNCSSLEEKELAMLIFRSDELNDIERIKFFENFNRLTKIREYSIPKTYETTLDYLEDYMEEFTKVQYNLMYPKIYDGDYTGSLRRLKK